MKKNIKFSERPILSFLFCHCEHRFGCAAIPSHPTYVIPAKAGIHPLYFFLFFFPLCHCELSKKVWQSHYSFISFIFCICIISSLAYNPNPLFLYKLNTKYQRLTTDFNNYALFLYNILHFFESKTIKKL